MKTTTKRPTKQRKARSCKIEAKEGDHFLLRIVQDGLETYYIATQDTGAHYGLVYRLEKQDIQGTAEVYNVNLGAIDEYPSCDCAGFTYHQKPCRHLLALEALLKAGKLPVAEPETCPFHGRPDTLVELGRDPIPGYDDEPETHGHYVGDDWNHDAA